jgi:hypothetical protein
LNSLKVGKKIVIAIIIVLVLTNVISTISMVVNVQADEKATTTFFGLVRFAIFGTILYYLYVGNKLAKWLIVIFALMNGILGFLSSLLNIILPLLLGSNISLSARDIINMLIYIICIVIGVLLIVSRPVNNFLTYQREELKKEINDYENES